MALLGHELQQSRFEQLWLGGEEEEDAGSDYATVSWLEKISCRNSSFQRQPYVVLRATKKG